VLSQGHRDRSQAAGEVAGVARNDELGSPVAAARQAPRSTLSDIYSWFTEGFDTTDLKEAKALLEKLAAK
jgi:adenylate cyclase